MSFTDDERGKIHADISNPRRYSYLLGESLQGRGEHTPKQFLEKGGRIKNFEDLRERFSVEALTKKFYDELFDWYLWAVEDSSVSFPDLLGIKDDSAKRSKKCEHVIRLITRLLFCWFVKQKQLIPDEVFTTEWARKVLANFSPSSTENSNYYNAVLQNLFFATLNNEIGDRRWAEDTNYNGRDPYYGIKCFYRDDNKASYFTPEGKEILEKPLPEFLTLMVACLSASTRKTVRTIK